MVLLLSAARSKRFGFEGKALLHRDDKMKPESIGMGVVSELLRCSLVPDNDEEGTFITDVWRYCSSALRSDEVHTSGLRDFLLMILLHTMSAKENSKNSSPFPPGAMFDLWASVAGNLTTKLAVEFCLRLEDCLAALFDAMDGQRTWAVYQRVCSLTPQVFVNLCMNTLCKRRESGDDNESTLLTPMLEYDCSNFSCLSTLFASIDADARMVKLWDCGDLDLVAAAFVLQTHKQKGASTIIATEPFPQVASIIGRRFLAIFSQKVSYCTTLD